MLSNARRMRALSRQRPLVNEVQEQLWQPDRHPPRTIVEVRALPRGDTIQIEGTFYVPRRQT